MAAKKTRSRARPEIRLLTPDTWDDFVTLFGARGACGGCWCMTPKLKNSEYEASKGAGNKRKQKRLVDRGIVPGLLAYLDGEVVGWCAVEPRDAYGRLERSRILAPVDDEPVWSIVCFFVRKDARGRGMTGVLIDAAIDHARAYGARIVEAYPQEPVKDRMPEVFAWNGIASAFFRKGFKEVARRSPTRPIVRKSVKPRRKRTRGTR